MTEGGAAGMSDVRLLVEAGPLTQRDDIRDLSIRLYAFNLGDVSATEFLIRVYLTRDLGEIGDPFQGRGAREIRFTEGQRHHGTIELSWWEMEWRDRLPLFKERRGVPIAQPTLHPRARATALIVWETLAPGAVQGGVYQYDYRLEKLLSRPWQREPLASDDDPDPPEADSAASGAG